MEAVYKKGLSQLYFLRRFRSFNVCNWMRQMFYQSVVAPSSSLWCPGVLASKQGQQQTEQTHKEGRVCSKLVIVEDVAEDRMLAKLLAILDNGFQPFHKTLDKLKQPLQLASPACSCTSEKTISTEKQTQQSPIHLELETPALTTNTDLPTCTHFSYFVCILTLKYAWLLFRYAFWCNL